MPSFVEVYDFDAVEKYVLKFNAIYTGLFIKYAALLILVVVQCNYVVGY